MMTLKLRTQVDTAIFYGINSDIFCDLSIYLNYFNSSSSARMR
jgi:hypothetical protein